LEEAEVKVIEIPIRTQFATPEGEYDIDLSINGKQLTKGERIRGKKKTVGTDWGKSATSSVALTALLLPLGGVGGFRISNNLKGKLVVSGKADKIDQTPFKIKAESVFGGKELKDYQKVYEWLTNSIDLLKEQKTRVLFARILQPWINELFQEKGIIRSKPELELISRYVAFQILSLIPGLATTIAYKVTRAIKQGIHTTEELQPNISSINNVALKLWVDSISEDKKLFLLALSAAICWRSFKPQIGEDILDLAKGIIKFWEEDGSQKTVFKTLVSPIIMDGIRVAPTLYPNPEERMNLYTDISEVYKSLSPEEEYARFIQNSVSTMIEKVIKEEQK